MGELHVRGRQLFKEYWNRPDATAKDLSPDGWFRCLLLVIRGSQSPEALVLWCMLIAFSMELLWCATSTTSMSLAGCDVCSQYSHPAMSPSIVP